MASIDESGVTLKQKGNENENGSKNCARPIKKRGTVASSRTSDKTRMSTPGKIGCGTNDEQIGKRVPEAIRSALSIPETRIIISQWERELLRFVKRAGKKRTETLVIPSVRLTSLYHRVLVHQLCQFINLSHKNNPQKDIVVSLVAGFDYDAFIKSEGSLFDVAPLPGRPLVPSLPASVKPVLKKREMSLKTSVSDILLEMNGLSLSQAPQNSEVSMQAARASKEAQYQKARDAIFESLDVELDEDNDTHDANDTDNTHNTVFHERLAPVAFQQNFCYVPYPQLASPCSLAGYPIDTYGPVYGQSVPFYPPHGTFPLNREMGSAPNPYGMYYDPMTQRRHFDNPYIVAPNAETTQASPWPSGPV